MSIYFCYKKFALNIVMGLNIVIIEQLPGNIPAFDRKGLIHEKKCFLSATKIVLGCPCIILDQFASFFYPYIVRFFVVCIFRLFRDM